MFLSKNLQFPSGNLEGISGNQESVTELVCIGTIKSTKEKTVSAQCLQFGFVFGDIRDVYIFTN